jgi:hypothetical protein
MSKLAVLLESYNNGTIGPGHCPNDMPPTLCECPVECPLCPPPCSPKDGCTRSQGYWKNHQELWYTADILPGDAAAFCNLHSWLYYLTQSPSGDAYYILTKQYIAAYLNINSYLTNACASPEILALMSQANALLMAKCGIVIGNSHPSRPLFISYATTLDFYNNGFATNTGDGPKECDEMKDDKH